MLLFVLHINNTTYAFLTAHQLDAGFTDIARALTSTVLVTQVREPPDISEADGVANAREEELHFASPVAADILRVAVQFSQLLGVNLQSDFILKHVIGYALINCLEIFEIIISTVAAITNTNKQKINICSVDIVSTKYIGTKILNINIMDVIAKNIGRMTIQCHAMLFADDVLLCEYIRDAVD